MKLKERFLNWSERVANSKNAMRSLFWVSFAESCISPFPAYFLVMFILAHKVKYSWKKVAFISTVSSILGGIVGYAIGYYFFKFAGQPIINFYHLQANFDAFGLKLQSNEFFILLIASMTPIPFKITAIASGVFAINFPLFIGVSILGRGIKFIIVSFVSQKYGAKMKEAMLESMWSTVITFVVILGAIWFFLFR